MRLLPLVFLVSAEVALAQIQAPALPGAPPISSSDRIYTGDQTSNTITVIKPSTYEVLGTITLGEGRLSNLLNPQYIKSVDSHGLGFSRDGKYINSISVTTNTLTVIKTLDNSIVSQTYVDRAPHEGFFSADNRTVWVATRGTDFVDIVDGIAGGIIGRVKCAPGPSKVLFSPDGATAYVNHIRSATLDIIDVKAQKVVHQITGLGDIFSSDMMMNAQGTIIWAAHKLAGKTSILDLETRTVVTVLETGAETNHPNFAIVNDITYAWLTVAATNETKVYRQDSPSSIPVYITAVRSSGIEPHGLWPSPDNTRMYVVNEHSDTVDVIDTANYTIIHTMRVGQEGQALVYVAGAVPSGHNGTQNLGVQGLGHRVENRVFPIEGHGNASTLLTVRNVNGLEMIQFIGRKLNGNTTYLASASCYECNGAQIPLLEFRGVNPNPMGCTTAGQVLGFTKFFDVYDINSVTVRPLEKKVDKKVD